MSRRSTGQGSTFADAVREAVADLVGGSVDDVVCKLDAPGLEGLRGPISIELDVQPERDEDAPPPARTRASRGDRGTGVSDRAARDDRDDREDDDAPEEVITAEDLDQEADAAADFLEGLLDAMDLPGDIRIRVEDDHAEVEVVEIGSGALIGRRGQTLEAIQELVRCSLQREFQRRSRVKVDAEGYRARRLEKLVEKAEEAIDEVLDTGEPFRMEPMDVFERKTVHRLVADVEGLISRSQGREPARRVVIERE